MHFFPPNFNEILSEFHDDVQKMTKSVDILIKAAEKIRKMAKNTEMVPNFIQFHFFISLFQSSPYWRWIVFSEVISFKTAKGNKGKPYTQITGRTQLQVIFDYNFVDVHLATDGSDKE